MNRDKIYGYGELLGRLMLVAIFLISGINKITQYAGTKAYMESMGVPGIVLPLVILVEIGASLKIIAGCYTRAAAIILAGFCILTAAIFHSDSTDQVQGIMFMKNISMAGGFLVLFANGAGPISFDRKRNKL